MTLIALVGALRNRTWRRSIGPLSLGLGSGFGGTAMLGLVAASAERAGRLYGVVVPRDAWWNRAGIVLVNAILRTSGSAFRVFVHPTEAIDRMLAERRLEPVYEGATFVWKVVVYARRHDLRGAKSG